MRLCTVDVSCCIAFPLSCSRACLKRGWMIYVYKSQFSVQWKIPHTRAPAVLENPHGCCSLVLSESCVCALALNISGQKASFVGSSASHARPPLLDWTVQEGGGEERRSAATVHTGSVCRHPCAVWLSASRVSHLLYFAVSRVAPFCCF